jgi:hypothetical protein
VQTRPFSATTSPRLALSPKWATGYRNSAHNYQTTRSYTLSAPRPTWWPKTLPSGGCRSSPSSPTPPNTYTQAPPRYKASAAPTPAPMSPPDPHPTQQPRAASEAPPNYCQQRRSQTAAACISYNNNCNSSQVVAEAELATQAVASGA